MIITKNIKVKLKTLVNLKVLPVSVCRYRILLCRVLLLYFQFLVKLFKINTNQIDSYDREYPKGNNKGSANGMPVA
jgi:hypothetical protein